MLFSKFHVIHDTIFFRCSVKYMLTSWNVAVSSCLNQFTLIVASTLSASDVTASRTNNKVTSRGRQISMTLMTISSSSARWVSDHTGVIVVMKSKGFYQSKCTYQAHIVNKCTDNIIHCTQSNDTIWNVKYRSESTEQDDAK